MIDRFEEGTATMGSAGQGVKAIVNSDDRDDVLVDDPLLLRAFRLRFKIKPPAIDIEDLHCFPQFLAPRAKAAAISVSLESFCVAFSSILCAAAPNKFGFSYSRA